MNKYLAVDLGKTYFENQQDIGAVAQKDTGFTDLISMILPNAWVIASIILFFYAVFGGFLIITAAGNAQNVQQGQQVIINALLGFLLVFASYWIIQLIEILTGVPILG